MRARDGEYDLPSDDGTSMQDGKADMKCVATNDGDETGVRPPVSGLSMK